MANFALLPLSSNCSCKLAHINPSHGVADPSPSSILILTLNASREKMFVTEGGSFGSISLLRENLSLRCGVIWSHSP